MAEIDRLTWEFGDAEIREPTPDELKALGAEEWRPSAVPPGFAKGLADDEVRSTGGVSAVVREHGELGPVLVDGDHHFTSEDDL